MNRGKQMTSETNRGSRPMRIPMKDARKPVSKAGRLGLAMTALALIVAVSGCANRDSLSTGSIPDDYRTRHPIIVGEKEKAIDIPIASGDRRLSQGQRDVIAGFAADFAASSSGTIQILSPQGSSNSGAAYAARKEIRRLFVQMGISNKRIIDTSYAAGGDGDAAPIRLSYVAIAAHTAPCGEWPEDMTLNTTQNRNYYNFGCASQSNLAAQIANPNDLLGPRRMTSPDAVARGAAIQRYRENFTELQDMSE